MKSASHPYTSDLSGCGGQVCQWRCSLLGVHCVARLQINRVPKHLGLPASTHAWPWNQRTSRATIRLKLRSNTPPRKRISTSLTSTTQKFASSYLQYQHRFASPSLQHIVRLRSAKQTALVCCVVPSKAGVFQVYLLNHSLFVPSDTTISNGCGTGHTEFVRQ
jgi:hypothetical protein